MEKLNKCPECGSYLVKKDSCLCGWKKEFFGRKVRVKKQIKCKFCDEDAHFRKLQMCLKHYEEHIGWPNQLKKFPQLQEIMTTIKADIDK